MTIDHPHLISGGVGSPYTPKLPFAYQRKCLRWIREEREALSDVDRRYVDSVLDGTGCEVLFA